MAQQPFARIERGQDPRKAIPGHRERGKATYRFTQADVAAAAGAPLSAVRRAKQRGDITSFTLDGILPWIFRERERRMSPSV